MRKAYGFTIVELLIVIVVIAILAAISAAAYGNISNRATDARLTDGAAKFTKALQAWMVDGGDMTVGNAGSTGPTVNGLCTNASGGQGFVGSTAYQCTTEDMLVEAGHLPAGFTAALPPNLHVSDGVNGRHSLMLYRCSGDSKKWMLFWTLRRPSAEATSNLHSTMSSCGYANPASHNIVSTWGMRAVRIINL